MSKRLFKNSTDWLVLAFIVLLLFMLARCEDAEAAWAVEEMHDSNASATEHNAGLDRVCGRYIFDGGASFAVCPLVAIGGDLQRDSFEIGFADELWPRWEGQITLHRTRGVMDGGFSIRRVVGDGPFQLTLGGSYWIDQSPGSNSNFTFSLGIRYTF